MKITPSHPKLLCLAAGLMSITSLPVEANYWGFDNIVQNQTYQMEFTPTIEADTTYWATMSVSSIGGYGGIQQGSGTSDHRGLFSLWDSTSTNIDALVSGYNPYLTWLGQSNFRFGNEGTGSQLLFQWNWVLGNTYRMAWRRYVVPGSSLVTYEAFYYDPYDPNANGWVWVGDLQRPQANDNERNMNGFEGFSEAYGGNYNDPREIKIRNVWLLDLTNHWDNIADANETDNRDEGFLTAIAGGWTHHSYDTNYSFQYTTDLPMLSDSTLTPIYLPYHINCGWNVISNTVSSGQVASSLSRAFEPDAFWNGTSTTNLTSSTISTSGVANAGPAQLYQSSRQGTNFGYTLFGLKPNDPALLRLHFVETVYNRTGSRVEDVVVNGTTVDANLDIRAVAGAKNKAVVRSYTVTPDSHGMLAITLKSDSGSVPATVSGIEAGSGITGTHVLVNQYSGKAVDDPGSSTSPVQVIQYTITGGANQNWSFIPDSDGSYTLQNGYSGLVLDDSGSSTADGNPIIQYSSTGNPNQHWNVTLNSDGSYLIKNVYSGKVLEDPNFSTTNSTGLDQWTANGGANQNWVIQ